MSEDGKKLLKNVKQMRKACSDISLLLLDVDKQLEREGWKAEPIDAMHETSGDLARPKGWIPVVLFRFYRHPNYRRVLGFVAVLLDDDPEGLWYTLSEPLITAGKFSYEKEILDEDWHRWYSRYYGYLMEKKKEVHHEGGILTADRLTRREYGWLEDGEFETIKCFAWPLVYMTSLTEVVTKITEPLLNLLRAD